MTSPLSICFRIANTSFCVQPAHPSLRLALPEPWAPFVTAPVDAPDACYTAEQASLPCDSSASSIYWGNDLWRISFPESGNTHLELANPNSGAWRTGAILSADFSSGVLFSDDAAIPPFDPIPFPLEHPLIIGRLSFLEGMVLHASCVRLKGRSFLFVGQSGRGKTTMARLWRSHGGEILNDERNIVRLM